ncbi:MAG: hypothetical protein AAF629_35250 [Chloroflexota bacterium]
MSLGKKLATLINATLRGGLPQRRRFQVDMDDPDGQLSAIREALQAVELQERNVAEKLKQTKANVDAAIDQGDQTEVDNQRRLIRELETQLETQSTEAITLSEQLAAIEAVLTEQRAAAKDKIAVAEDHLSQPENAPAEDDVNHNTDTRDTDNHDEELSARKSRLSG